MHDPELHIVSPHRGRREMCHGCGEWKRPAFLRPYNGKLLCSWCYHREQDRMMTNQDMAQYVRLHRRRQ